MPTEPQSQPLVSIIVPVYNAADHIARCIEITKLHVYAGPDHDQAAQKPEVLKF